ncbi:hypothetical protein BMS3Abin06_01852 [bacterium BMS3Abin06]|nr:hypothetical protein BMS3Abin06_01852 [bacterium BMS3Abin06]HDZ01984.1 hypothetical protein [Nitrospirota bacterium]
MAFKGDLPVIVFGDHTRSIKYVNRRFAVGAEGVKILKKDGPYYAYILRLIGQPMEDSTGGT